MQVWVKYKDAIFITESPEGNLAIDQTNSGFIQRLRHLLREGISSVYLNNGSENILSSLTVIIDDREKLLDPYRSHILLSGKGLFQLMHITYMYDDNGDIMIQSCTQLRDCILQSYYYEDESLFVKFSVGEKAHMVYDNTQKIVSFSPDGTAIAVDNPLDPYLTLLKKESNKHDYSSHTY